MKQTNHKVALAAGVVLALLDFQLSRAETGGVLSTPTTARHVLNRQAAVVVRFAMEGTAISEEAKKQLEQAIKECRAEGKIERVDVVAWPDKEFTGKQSELPKSQVALADERARNIEGQLDQIDSTLSVSQHNMATKPSALADLLNTSDANFKKTLRASGLSATDQASAAKRSGTAMVFFKVKKLNSAKD